MHGMYKYKSYDHILCWCMNMSGLCLPLHEEHGQYRCGAYSRVLCLARLGADTLVRVPFSHALGILYSVSYFRS